MHRFLAKEKHPYNSPLIRTYTQICQVLRVLGHRDCFARDPRHAEPHRQAEAGDRREDKHHPEPDRYEVP